MYPDSLTSSLFSYECTMKYNGDLASHVAVLPIYMYSIRYMLEDVAIHISKTERSGRNDVEIYFADVKGNNFRRTIYPLSLTVSFEGLEVLKGRATSFPGLFSIELGRREKTDPIQKGKALGTRLRGGGDGICSLPPHPRLGNEKKKPRLNRVNYSQSCNIHYPVR